MKKNNSQNTAAEINKLGQELLVKIQKVISERDKKILAIVKEVENREMENIKKSIHK